MVVCCWAILLLHEHKVAVGDRGIFKFCSLIGSKQIIYNTNEDGMVLVISISMQVSPASFCLGEQGRMQKSKGKSMAG